MGSVGQCDEYTNWAITRVICNMTCDAPWCSKLFIFLSLPSVDNPPERCRDEMRDACNDSRRFRIEYRLYFKGGATIIWLIEFLMWAPDKTQKVQPF